MGLPIAKAVVEAAAAGRSALTSQRGRGSTIFITCRPITGADRRCRFRVFEGRIQANEFGKLLIVDDEPQIRRVLRATLSSQGYTVAEARSGDEALEQIRGQQPDLILLDVI